MAVLSYGSFAVTVNVAEVPAVVGVGKPETVNVDAVPGLTVKADVPETVPSVALTVQPPDLADVYVPVGWSHEPPCPLWTITQVTEDVTSQVLP